jgi:Ca2+-binding EF-hand superfamily protein
MAAQKEELDPVQMAQYKDAFKLFDKNEDGVIDFNEFSEVTKSIGMESKPEAIKQIIDTIGSDNKVSFNQFMAVMTGKMKNMDQKKDVLKAFQVFDEKKDGTVRAGQLKHLLLTFYKIMSPAECDALINEAQQDAEGNIRYGPFVDKLFNLK